MAAVCAAFIALSTSAAFAASESAGAPAQTAVRGSGTILIVRVEGDDGVIARLRAELASGAWRIVELATDANEAELSTLAAQHDATAAVRCDVSRALELWVTGASAASPGSLDTIDVAGAQRDPGVPAWRAMEALRARGLRFNEPEPAAPPPEPSASERRAEEERRNAAARKKAAQAAAERARRKAAAVRRHVGFELGPAYVWSPGGLSGSVNGWGGARFDSGRWSLSALAFVPLTATRFARVEGEAQISTFMVAAAADISWLQFDALRFSSGIGFGESVTTFSGTARAGYVGSTVQEWLPTAFARSRVRVALGSTLALGGDVLLGATAHHISLEFGDRRVATWGAPWLACALSLEATLGL